MKHLLIIAALLASQASWADNHSHTPKFSKLGEGDITHYVGRDIHHHVSVGDLPSNIALFEETLPPKSLGAPPHTHTNEDEIFIVLKGHFEDFFKAVERAMAEGGPKTPPQVGQIIAETAAKYGVMVDMSKLPPSGLALLGPPPEK